jgi:hypothetical protein
VQSLPSPFKDIVVVPAHARAVLGQRTPLPVRALRLLPLLFASPQRALFTAGLALGLVSPQLLRLVASRALMAAIGPTAVERRKGSGEEVIVEQFFASRVVIRRR